MFAELSEGPTRRLRLALISGSSSASQDLRLLDSAIGDFYSKLTKCQFLLEPAI